MAEIPCPAKGCAGTAVRQLGGHPATGSPKVNMGGYRSEQLVELIGEPLHVPLSNGLCVTFGKARISTSRQPKAQA